VDRADVERIFEWDSLLDDTNYYELLGLLEIADQPAIVRAFHEFAAAFHPDVHPGADAETAGAIRRVFQRGTEAYRVLARPELRAEYDLVLAGRQAARPKCRSRHQSGRPRARQARAALGAQARRRRERGAARTPRRPGPGAFCHGSMRKRRFWTRLSTAGPLTRSESGFSAPMDQAGRRVKPCAPVWGLALPAGNG
jgi:curved DNA-binding protein CbpA